jgi:tetratricopeptide (TPR) repeat protein
MSEPQSEREPLNVDYGCCPLPKTHKRLIEAHVLWHQSLEQYQEPALFQANLNATIQALRNITFILQSEKHLFRKFDVWYEPWQKRLKEDPVLRWLIAARNTVVKEGELETASTAIVKLVTWKNDILIETNIPSGTSPTLILRNIPLLELVGNMHLPPNDLDDAVIVIERRWSVPELDGREVLEALAHAYGLLSDLVLDAHIILGKTSCISVDGEHSHFHSAHHPHGSLPCMALGIERRSHSLNLKTGQHLQLHESIPPYVDPAIAAKRYELDQLDKILYWEMQDPLLYAQRILHIAKHIIKKDKSLVRVLLIREGGGAWRRVVLEAANRTEKHLLMQMVARFIESVGGDAVIDVSEAWILPSNNDAIKAHFDNSQHVEGRGEAISVLVATREGLLKTYITPFKRGPFGGIKMGDTEDKDGGYPFYLKPIFDVWQTQGLTLSADGKPIMRLWEPDPLDICFCGGPKRFAECCRPMLDTLDLKADGERRINEAIADHNLTLFEKLAKAELAQYVIWVRQQTSPTRHVAPELHHMFVKADVPALTAYVRQMGKALIANGHADSFQSQIRQIGKVIGVPELSIRLIALAAELLFNVGDYTSAVKEMQTLGDPECLNDTLAIVLATQLLDLPVQKKTRYLTHAVSCALWEYERWVAELKLVRHLSDCGKQDEARQKVDSVISELTEEKTHRGLLANAMSLRWNITNEEKDFQTAKTELEKSTDSESLQNLGIILIDHGDYDEAERFLSDALSAGDPVAQLMIVDARIRANRIASARNLLLTIVPESIPPHLLLTYAVAYALVALACEDDDLKKVAAARLRQLPSIGSLVEKDVNNFLGALEGHGNPPQMSTNTPIRTLFKRWK